jgi:Uma2 family endonuclease
MTSVLATPLTLPEFLALPPTETAQELVSGQAIAKMSPKYLHALLQTRLLLSLYPYVKDQGRLLTEWAVILKCQGQDWVPVPDLLYISFERLPPYWQENQACPAIPELVIEIVSPGQSLVTMGQKARDYLEVGIDRVWLVDPEAQTVTVFAADVDPQTYGKGRCLTDSGLPNLKLDLTQIFS